MSTPSTPPVPPDAKLPPLGTIPSVASAAGGAPRPDAPMSFDRADFAGAAADPLTVCAGCSRPLTEAYFMVQGRVACAACHDATVAASRGGSRLGRFVKAGFLGSIAGALGAGLYFLVAHFTGYEFGLIAILVGLAVGVAVRAGSAGRGGWLYQMMAMFLTYSAIVVTYVPMLAEELRETEPAMSEDAAAGAAAPAVKSAATTLAPAPTNEVPEDAGVVSDAAGEAGDEGMEIVLEAGKPMRLRHADGREEILGDEPVPEEIVDDGPSSIQEALASDRPAMRLLAYAIILPFAYAAPILAGFGNFLGWIIIGFALYEAWKINKRTPLAVTGPHPIGTLPPRA